MAHYPCCRFDSAPRDFSVMSSEGRSLLPVLLIAMLLIVTAAGAWLVSKSVAPRAPEMRAVLDVLRSEQVQQLATDRVTEEVTLVVNDSTLLLGRREGLLTAIAHVYYGIDVARIASADVNTRSHPITVRLPEPALIDVAVDLESVRFITKTSGLNVVSDYLNARNLREELLRQLQRQAIRQLQTRGALPDRAALVARLNVQSDRLFAGSAAAIRFR